MACGRGMRRLSDGLVAAEGLRRCAWHNLDQRRCAWYDCASKAGVGSVAYLVLRCGRVQVGNKQST